MKFELINHEEDMREESLFDGNDPAGTAVVDQERAEAIGRLREAGMFVLISGDAESSVLAGGELGVHVDQSINAAFDGSPYEVVAFLRSAATNLADEVKKIEARLLEEGEEL